MTRFAAGFVALVAVSGVCIPLVNGQGAGTPDQTFVTKASGAGMAEVEFGELGSAHAMNAEVKRFAERMVTDHQKANEELKGLARKKNYTLASGPMKEHQEAAARVGKLQGEQFDRDFMAQMVKDHEAAVELFSSEAQSGQDAELKAWAAKTLPTLREHLQLAKALATRR
jgi:putative membrane protein